MVKIPECVPVKTKDKPVQDVKNILEELNVGIVEKLIKKSLEEEPLP